MFHYSESVLNSILGYYNNVLFVDTETTGFHADTDQITEFAAIKVTINGVEARFSTFVQLSEGFSIPEKLVSLTGITDEMCKTGISRPELFAQIASLMDSKTLIVAYNAQFDAGFLLKLAEENHNEVILLPTETLAYLDALTIFRERAAAPHKLSDAIAHYQVEGRNSHRAIEDALALLEVTKAMAAEKDDLLSYVNRFGYKARYGINGKQIAGISYFEQID